jgi:hypothetical protein
MQRCGRESSAGEAGAREVGSWRIASCKTGGWTALFFAGWAHDRLVVVTFVPALAAGNNENPAVASLRASRKS